MNLGSPEPHGPRGHDQAFRKATVPAGGPQAVTLVRNFRNPADALAYLLRSPRYNGFCGLKLAGHFKIVECLALQLPPDRYVALVKADRYPPEFADESVSATATCEALRNRSLMAVGDAKGKLTTQNIFDYVCASRPSPGDVVQFRKTGLLKYLGCDRDILYRALGILSPHPQTAAFLWEEVKHQAVKEFDTLRENMIALILQDPGAADRLLQDADLQAHFESSNRLYNPFRTFDYGRTISGCVQLIARAVNAE